MASNDLFSLLIITFLFSFSTLPHHSSSLSTVAISHTANLTLICALIPSNRESYINCTSFPTITQNPITSNLSNPITSNLSFSAIVGGNGFLCGLRSQSTLEDTISCWRFLDNGTVLNYRNNGTAMTTGKRIYLGPSLDELQSGTSSFCGLVAGTHRLKCWPQTEFNQNSNRSFSFIAVGEGFVCGLSSDGNITCLERNWALPIGNFSVLAAGSRHACAIRINGSVECWGENAGTAPLGEFKSLALGDGRSCAIRNNGTVVCWGVENFGLPENLTNTVFLEIEAKGNVFCGIQGEDYSLICWGNENLWPSRTVFSGVLPGPCRLNCPCHPLLGSGLSCAAGRRICQFCELRPAPESPWSSPALPPAPTDAPPGSSENKGRVAFLVVGSVGSFIGVGTIVWFLLFRFFNIKGCRVHDSGRLDEAAPTTPMPSARRMGRAESAQPQLDKRLSQLLSLGPSSNMEEFPLHVLLRLTDNFSEEHKIGMGSFGSVYRATLDDGREVAIKRAELTSSLSYAYAGAVGTKRQEKEYAFLSELALLSRLNHKHLVQLIGYGEDANERVLVYEYMPNDTLHHHLHKLESSPLMSWVARLEVALGAARGIEYLHTYAVPPIIHRDIKSSNILLDANWMPKVADFGLSLMGPDDQMTPLSLGAAGTVGYMDPEYYRLQQLTTKSDVYSFGVVLLELLTGLKAIHRLEDNGMPRNLVDFAVPYIETDEMHHILDPKLPPPTPREIEPVIYAGYLAGDCVRLEGRERPSMTEIVTRLERALAACLVQPCMSRSTTGSST